MSLVLATLLVAASVDFRIEVVAVGLEVPSGLVFPSRTECLIAERPSGRLTRVELETGDKTPLEGVPAVHGSGDGGLLDVALHPGFATNQLLYLAYSARVDGGTTTVLDRARLEAGRLSGLERLFEAKPPHPSDAHYGARVAIRDGYVYLSLGERDHRELAPDLRVHHGKIVRLHDDGRVPEDNPFVGRDSALPEIWSYGHRNPQGLAVHPQTGELFEHEHGPKGGDEVNVILPGRNYGWPIITYGREYTGEPVGDGLTHGEGLEQPLYQFTPSIAPSGMDFYTGAAFPDWRGNLFLGAMALRHLSRLTLEGTRVIGEERLLLDERFRVRVVRQGPDGLLYVGVDEGKLVRLRPR
jgi:glucose/arabinose dehydrogenase